jgi:hypothetical protein
MKRLCKLKCKSQERFKQHALNPLKKKIINVSIYKPFVKCFEFKVVFSSYKNYLSAHKEWRLILDLKLFKNHMETIFWKLDLWLQTINIESFRGKIKCKHIFSIFYCTVVY